LRTSAVTLLLICTAAAQQPIQGPRENIVVTATYEPLSLEEIDRALRVLPVRSQSILFNSLADVLRLDPALDLASRVPNGIQADLSIRGSTFGQTLILLNGQRLNDPQSGHHNLDVPVPLEAIERVEVLRGSGSAFYGSDAVAGVVNIITSPPEATEFRLRTAFGSDGINQQRASLAFVGRKLSQQFSASRDFSTGFRADRDYRNLSFASTTRYTSGLGTGTLNLDYMDHPFGADQFYGNFNSWENTKTWFAGVQQAFGLNTTASFSYRRHSDLFVLYRDRPEVFTNHHSDESWQMALRRRHELNSTSTFYYGVEGFHESVASTNLGDHARSRVAAYTAVDLRAWKRFSLNLAAREELYRKWSGAFTPSISAGYWASPILKFRASVSRAFRVPGYTELYYHDPANIGTPTLRPERAWSYEIGSDWVPSQRVHADVTLFTRRERDVIDYYRPTPDSIYRALNIQNLTFRGLEAGVRYTPSRTHTIDLRYAAIEGEQDTIPAGQTKYTFNYPKQSGVFAWQITPNRNFVMRTRIGALERTERDPYVLAEIYLAMPHGRIHPFVQASNLSNTSYQEVRGVPMPGRTIVGGIELLLRKR
jgi:iron complex outermembrane receptor protein